MSKRRKSLLPFLALVLLFVTGALNRQVLFSTSPTQLPHSAASPLAHLAWRPCEGDPAALLDAFLRRVDPAQTQWLRVRIRQSMTCAEQRFDSESRILLGPNACGRLEMEVRNASGKTKLIVVSDGVTLAQSRALPDAKAEIKVLQLPPRDSAALRTQTLLDHGCASPWRLLQQARPQLKELRLEAADGRKRIVANVEGDIAGLPFPVGKTIECRLYFSPDGELDRLEWRSPTGDRTLGLDFSELAINQPLSEEECAKEFSFPAVETTKAPKTVTRN